MQAPDSGFEFWGVLAPNQTEREALFVDQLDSLKLEARLDVLAEERRVERSGWGPVGKRSAAGSSAA